MLGLRYLFIFPKYSLSIPDGPPTMGMLVFAAGAAAIIAAGEFVRRDNATLHRAQGELGEKVPQSTAGLHAPNHHFVGLSARLLHLPDEERPPVARAPPD